MSVPIVLASGSPIRAEMLRNAGVGFSVVVPRVDEDTLKQAMMGEKALSRDIADAVAEMKARKVSGKQPESLVIGCDQVLDFRGSLLSKPDSSEHAFEQLSAMRSGNHTLFSAAVIYQGGEPLWRHVARVKLRMRAVTDEYIGDYINRNWDCIRHCVGAYQLEKEGVRLFDHIEGDYFSVLGMPLLEILNYLTLRGAING